MRRLLVLGLLALLIVAILPLVVWGGSPVSPLTSPLDSPVTAPKATPTPTHAMIPYEVTVKLTDPPPDPDYCPGGCKPAPTATPTPAPASCNSPGWWRLPDWMGNIPLWTDGQSYCVEGMR